MSAKSGKTRLAIAGACVNVELRVTLSFNETMALKYVLDRLDQMLSRRVMTVPDDIDPRVTFDAIGKLRDHIFMVEPEGRKLVILRANLTESEAA